MLRCAVPLRVVAGGELVHTHWLKIVRNHTQITDIRDNAPQYVGVSAEEFSCFARVCFTPILDAHFMVIS